MAIEFLSEEEIDSILDEANEYDYVPRYNETDEHGFLTQDAIDKNLNDGRELIIVKQKLHPYMNSSLKSSFNTYSIQNFDISETFVKVDTLDKDNYVAVIFTFTSEEFSHKIQYYIPKDFVCILEHFMLGGFEELKSKIDSDNLDAVTEVFESLSRSFLTSINAYEFDFCKNLQLKDVSNGLLELEEDKKVSHLYVLNLTIEDKEYKLYLQADDKFSIMFL